MRYEHYAIYAGDRRVIHFDKSLSRENPGKRYIHEGPIEEFWGEKERFCLCNFSQDDEKEQGKLILGELLPAAGTISLLGKVVEKAVDAISEKNGDKCHIYSPAESLKRAKYVAAVVEAAQNNDAVRLQQLREKEDVPGLDEAEKNFVLEKFVPKKILGNLLPQSVLEAAPKVSYNLFSNNCEDFALWCKMGVHESRQVQDLVRAIGWAMQVLPVVSGKLKSFIGQRG